MWLFTNGTFRCDAPADFATPLADRTALGGSVVQLDPGALGCPVPVFNWRFNGQLLAAETNATLVLSNVTASNAGLYEVTASNRWRMATSAANLVIRTKPDVRVTEVMPNPAASPGVPTADWWELTSFASQPVDLTGWRFNDSLGGLIDAYVFTSGPTIAPGESIVFIEALTLEEFHAWWGDTNLPPGLQIITYSGNGLSFSDTGDTLLLWDNTSTDPEDTVYRADFGVADRGVSFNYDPIIEQFGFKSELGSNGVIRAAAAPDIGSPGRIMAPDPGTNAPPVRPVMSASLAMGQLRIDFEVLRGGHYSLEVSDDLWGGVWSPTGLYIEAMDDTLATFTIDAVATRRFFRLRVTSTQ
jgi:hypothetical protein